MIAGLLGEHLASPRTALKTNQNTALEPKPALGGDSSSKEDFASYVADDPKPKDSPQTRSDLGTRDANAASDATKERSSEKRDARAENLAEADAKPLPVPIDLAETPPVGISPDTALGDTPEILPASVPGSEQADIAASAEELLANARQIDPRTRAEVPGDAAIGDLASDQNIKFTQGSNIEPALSENELKRLLSQGLAESDGQSRPPNAPIDAEIDLGRLGSHADIVDGELTPIGMPAETTDAQLRNAATTDLQTTTGDLASDQNIKFTQGSNIEPALSENELKRLLSQGLAENDGQSRPPNAPIDAETDLGRLGSHADIVDGELTRIGMPVETTDAQLRNAATTGLQTTAGDFATMIRDGAATGADTVVNIGPTSAQSGPTVAMPAGMTPVAPSIPIASPSELTGIIMNAIQNGMDPQEQLIVQLDPPELGRIMIDFKFDAQGLQQIVVTSENPEALKRLREMHAELTAALRDQGLTGENLSFQQDTQDRSQTSWGSPSRSDRELVFSASDDGRSTRMTGPPEPGSGTRTRLDLVL